MFVEGIDKENLPEGWRLGKLGEVCEITMGQSPEGDSYNETGEGEIFYQGRTDFGNRYPSIRMYTTNPTKIANKEDILISVRAPVGDINIATNKCCIGRGLASIRHLQNKQSYLFYLLQSLSKIFNLSNESGTIFGSINKESMNSIGITIPSSKEIGDFDNKAKVIDNLIIEIEQENEKLLTLQKLMLSGMGR